MATTSTKSPAVIKQDIKRVLDRMQIQYRETKSGFECIHAPSIDINSIVDSPHTPQRGHRKQGSSGSGETETTRKSITRKSSKMSFGKRSRDREKVVDATIKDRGAVAGAAVVAAVSVPGASEREKELPSRPSGGTVLSMTPSSASSSFFHVGANSHTQQSDAARSDTLEATASHGGGIGGGGEDASLRSHSPTASKNLPPIPRDFAQQGQHQFPTSAGPVDHDTFEAIGSSSLSVRFDINIVKVRLRLAGRCHDILIHISQVPWLPLHGIQFRRCSGDGWQYHMLARRVLTELKL